MTNEWKHKIIGSCENTIREAITVAELQPPKDIKDNDGGTL